MTAQSQKPEDNNAIAKAAINRNYKTRLQQLLKPKARNEKARAQKAANKNATANAAINRKYINRLQQAQKPKVRNATAHAEKPENKKRNCKTCYQPEVQKPPATEAKAKSMKRDSTSSKTRR